MAKLLSSGVSRRAFLAGSAAALGAAAVAQSMNSAATTEMEGDISQSVRRNISSFRTLH